ncbi:alpha/beta hydrolase [Lentibacillus saliphilus]|uniref:alpha/beta hydrolase n=1 Tax=Lentibacillus saliphilus TaxID=2737028 RepID=UPI001C3004DC|nr:alpha/beta hydrolase [Lentibacillus saliphilus]
MKYIYYKGTDSNKSTMLLLHGTGGTETDLLPISEKIDPDAAVLGVRGNVLENGMPRFFKRLAEGVFDEADLKQHTEELYDFINHKASEHQFDREHVIALGYSNGANIAASLLFLKPNALHGAILFRPMVPLRDVQLPDLTGISVFIGAGKNDPLCPPEETDELAQLLRQAGAQVDIHWSYHGHQLTQEDIQAATLWYNGLSN